jgi:hypothetical protein
MLSYEPTAISSLAMMTVLDSQNGRCQHWVRSQRNFCGLTCRQSFSLTRFVFYRT